MRVKDAMSKNPEIITPNTTLCEAAQLMRECDCGYLPVGENDRLIGAITDRDMVVRALAEGRDPDTTEARGVMTAKILYCFEDDDLEEAGEMMKKQQVRRLVVLNDDSDLRARVNVRGRATGEMTRGRFEKLEVEYEQAEAGQVPTEVFKDSSRSIISTNDSPDLGFSASFNPYRGCEHGCIYCYARPTHEYLGLSAGLDFERKIFAKPEAPQLLRAALGKKSWQPQIMMLSGVTDCYQPIERELQLTRQCLKVLAEFRNPVGVITKNYLVTRDIDVLKELTSFDCAHVTMSITTLDKELARKMEPRASQPERRLKAVEELAKAGIPVSVNMAPIVPGLTDHEIPSLLKAAADAGALSAHYTLVRLPYGVKDLFQVWLEENYPLKKQKVLNRIREMRGGKLNVSEFGKRMSGEGEYAEQIDQLFKQSRKRYGLDKKSHPLSTEHFRRVTAQMELL